MASIVEVFSIGAVVPFLGVLASPERIYNNEKMLPIIQFLQISEPRELIFPTTLFFGLAAVASGILRYLLLTYQTKVTYSIGADLSVTIFERTLYQPYLKHVSRNSSEVIAGVSNKANDLIVSLLFPGTIIISSIIMLGVVTIALIAIEPVLTIASAMAFGAYYGLVLLISRRSLGVGSKIIAMQYGNVVKLIQEGLGGIRDILLDGTQATFVRSYRDAEVALRSSRARMLIISGTPRFVVETVGTLFIAGLAFYLTTQNTDGFSDAIPVLGAVALAAQRLLPVMQQLFSSWASIASGRKSVEDALDLLEQPMPTTLEVAPALPVHFSHEIVFKEVAFRYATDMPSVFQNVNLRIPKGSRLGVVGETGSGKSTLIDLILGLTLPTEGKIQIDGRTLDRDLIRGWQSQIAHVPQFIYLADATVAQNIAFGQSNSEINEEMVQTAARTAQIHDVIAQLPEGYHTVIGERGTRLSGGQRQRLGIARALYKRASVIVFDEATSALDADTENAVMNAIHNLPIRITLIIVAHRHSTLQNCSSIIKVANGKITNVDSLVLREPV